MDFEAAARMSGSRFVVLKGELARLERALGQFMIDMQTQEHGYTEVSPPLLVRDAAVYGTGKLPKFADDLFHTTDGRWLIPTAEVSLTNLVHGPDRRRRGAAAPLHRADPLLPLGGRRLGPRHPRHDPPAPVLQGASWSRSRRRTVRRRARADGRLRRGGPEAAGAAVPHHAALHRRHGLRRAQDLRPGGLAAVARTATARSAPAPTAATSRPGAWTRAPRRPARRARASSTP